MKRMIGGTAVSSAHDDQDFALRVLRGVFSSRKIQKRLVEDVAFRVLAAGNQPDFRTTRIFGVTSKGVEKSCSSRCYG